MSLSLSGVKGGAYLSLSSYATSALRARSLLRVISSSRRYLVALMRSASVVSAILAYSVGSSRSVYIGLNRLKL